INYYEDIATKDFQGAHLQTVKHFESLSETKIRHNLNLFYKNTEVPTKRGKHARELYTNMPYLGLLSKL
ncbi:MAG: hypothetical protein QXZ37_01125, partial [Sulfolobales archaeon]